MAKTKGKRNPSQNKSTEKGSSEVKEKGAKRDPAGLGFLAITVSLAVAVSVIHGVHLSNLFENDRFFSHLSTLERELSFRTEMGLYYSYYKTIVHSETFLQGLTHIVQDNRTEFPDTINTLKRFNLYPEVFLAFGFRLYDGYLNWRGISGKECFTINRGYGQPPVESCSGIGDETYFYVYSVFGLNGLLAGLFFLMAVYLSGSILGGILAVASFFYNHSESTRVMWTPPLRESFAYPFLLAQMFCVTWTLRTKAVQKKHIAFISVTSVLFMLPWQFSQFALLTQTVSLFGVYVLGYLGPVRLKLIVFGQTIALMINYFLQFGNSMLLTSYFGPCLASVMLVLLCEPFWRRVNSRFPAMLLKVVLLCFSTLAMKSILGFLFQLTDDAHIGHILKAKFGLYKDFHTMLYTCAREFDFIEWEYIQKTSATLLFPSGLVVTLVLLGKLGSAELDKLKSTSKPKKDGEEDPQPLAVLLYHLFQLMTFGVIAFLIMRLKLFFTPHLCVTVAFLASKEVFGFLRTNHRNALVIGLLALMTIKGQANVREQMNTVGEFNNADHEGLIQWIQRETSPDAVFAGSMPVCASVKLSAERPIVNHPHYEDAGLRERTHRVYQIYSKKPADVIHNTLSEMGVNYIIVEGTWCGQRPKTGCSMSDLWDYEDKENEDRELFCDLALNRDVPKPFTWRFQNDAYLVLKV